MKNSGPAFNNNLKIPKIQKVFYPFLVRKISKCPKHVLFGAPIGQQRTHDLDSIRFDHFIFIIFFHGQNLHQGSTDLFNLKFTGWVVHGPNRLRDRQWIPSFNEFDSSHQSFTISIFTFITRSRAIIMWHCHRLLTGHVTCISITWPITWPVTWPITWLIWILWLTVRLLLFNFLTWNQDMI